MFEHRPAADRRQGPVRPAPGGARRHPHPDRKKAQAVASSLVDIAFDAFAQQRVVSRRSEAVLDFLYERLRGYLRDRGYTANQVAAVVDSRPDCIADLPERLEAVRAFEALPEALSLSAANKRIVNILRKESGSRVVVADDELDRRLLGTGGNLRRVDEALPLLRRLGRAAVARQRRRRDRRRASSAFTSCPFAVPGWVERPRIVIVTLVGVERLGLDLAELRPVERVRDLAP